MPYDVILWVPVKVKFVTVEAPTQLEAIEAAEKALVIDKVIPTQHGPFPAPGTVEPGTIDYVEPDDAPERALVDEAGDEDYENSVHYVSKHDGSWVEEPDFDYIKMEQVLGVVQNVRFEQFNPFFEGHAGHFVGSEVG